MQATRNNNNNNNKFVEPTRYKEIKAALLIGVYNADELYYVKIQITDECKKLLKQLKCLHKELERCISALIEDVDEFIQTEEDDNNDTIHALNNDIKQIQHEIKIW
jgi:peptidoglycan hydrolase CwlO-like protein